MVLDKKCELTDEDKQEIIVSYIKFKIYKLKVN